ncbi:MAG: argininosuccinate lyase [Elusimicrobiota bacterium]
MEKLWGGRFRKEIDKTMQIFVSSIYFDKKLVKYDILGSIAHAKMLGKCKIITRDDADKIIKGLKDILSQIKDGSLTVDNQAEDIHSWVESILTEKIGEIAGKLHTARSRNDQVALDERIFLRDEINTIQRNLDTLQRALLFTARNHLEIIMPGYTHLQHAQPLLFSHYLLAYFFKFNRDRERLEDLYKRVDVLPLGSAALAGTSYPIDRQYLAKELNFNEISQNSLDAVSDRDFIIEFLSDSAMIMLHLSRLSEEIILWSSQEFDFIELDDSFCTGSSIMPQKKNPDAAELIRGKTGRVYGHLINLLTVMKALPLAYNHDMQEDKEPLFDSVEVLNNSLIIMSGMVKTLQVKSENMRNSLKGDFSNATEVADYLVKKGLAFRNAHQVVGEIVLYCIEQKKNIEQLSLEEFQHFQTLFAEDILKILSPEDVVDAKKSYGGTSVDRVEEAIIEAEKILDNWKTK